MTALGKKGSYSRSIHLVDGVNALSSDAYLIHPNKFTNKGETGNIGPWSEGENYK